MKGFQPDSIDETKIQVIVRRLLPAVRRQDETAFSNGVINMSERYGHQLAAEAIRVLSEDHDWITDYVFNRLENNMPKEMWQEFVGRGADAIAESLESEGLRIEDHMRRGDQGFAFSKQAINVIVGSGYPKAYEFGEGHESLSGIGLSRDPYVHPLAEFTERDGDALLNVWAVTSVTINCAMGWDESEQPDRAKALLKELVMIASPTCDMDKLMHRARYDDRVLLRLASLAKSGLDAKVNSAA